MNNKDGFQIPIMFGRMVALSPLLANSQEEISGSK
jgi:hypothetical protein